MSSQQRKKHGKEYQTENESRTNYFAKNNEQDQNYPAETNRVSTSTNIDEPLANHGNLVNDDELKAEISFPLIEIETADSFWNSENGNQGFLFNDSDAHQHHSSNIFDSSASAIFDESEIDIENASFVSEISALAFSTSNISSSQSPTNISKGQKKKNRNLDNSIFSSVKHGRKKKKSKNKFVLEDDFLLNSHHHFFDYYKSYDDPNMPSVLCERWKKKLLSLRKEIITAYRAEDSRLTNNTVENVDQRLREEEEVRKEKVVEFGISHATEKSSPIYDDQDKELEICQLPHQPSFSKESIMKNKNNNDDLQIIEERELKIDDIDFDSMNDPVNTNTKVSPLLILSLAFRFLFYIGYILSLC